VWVGTELSGIAVAARWNVSDREVRWLSGDEGLSGGVALRVSVQSPLGDIGFCNATTFHFANHHVAKRERQMPEVAAFAQRGGGRGGFPPVLVGDFNTDPESAEIRFLKGLQSLDGRGAYFCDAWEWAGDGGKGATWSNVNPHAARWYWPNRRIDYVLVGHPRADGAGRIEACKLVFAEPADGVWPSDHFGVFASLSAGSG
jgi:endonuclease/exonuclease/phosphatase family metal-dependent hydrolase